jgi:3-hydroxybutyrate dehydrogenase
MKLDGRVCLITGAASGIGKGIAGHFAAEGAKVAIADLNIDAAKAAADEINATHPGCAMGVAMNVADESQVNAGVASVAAAWGSVDVLVSNAGPWLG